MNIEYLKEQLTSIEVFRDTYKTSTTEDKYLHNELSKTIRVIKNKIWNEEYDESNKSRLKTKTVDGVEVIIPEFMSCLDDNYTYKYIDDTLYALPTVCSKDNDNTFHEYVYAYIKENDNKHVRFLVRLLGGDRFGDRIFTEANYYKKIESNYKYLNKNYGKDNRFPEKFRKQVETIIDEFKKLDGVNDFNPLKGVDNCD